MQGRNLLFYGFAPCIYTHKGQNIWPLSSANVSCKYRMYVKQISPRSTGEKIYYSSFKAQLPVLSTTYPGQIYNTWKGCGFGLTCFHSTASSSHDMRAGKPPNKSSGSFRVNNMVTQMNVNDTFLSSMTRSSRLGLLSSFDTGYTSMCTGQKHE